MKVIDCETESAFTWFCPICRCFGEDPRIWINEDKVSKFSLQEFVIAPECPHFRETQITCTGTREDQTCSSILSFQEMLAIFPEIRIKKEEHLYFSDIDEDSLIFTKTGLIKVSQWMPENKENTVYRKVWFDGDCQKCGRHHNSWSYL